MKILVGCTGFVGSNLYTSGAFDAGFHSTNISDAYGLQPDLLVYAGLRAEKYLANQSPEEDKKLILEAEENIRKIAPKKLVLISTIDVYKNPKDVNENSFIDTVDLHPYGYNRYLLECWVREHYPDALIIRLPGLFGKNIKKNFIYDFITRIPFMLKNEKMEELSAKRQEIKQYYQLQENGFYKVKELSAEEKEKLMELLKELDFSALNFTDSRSRYQFYPLKRLWNDIQIALENDIKLWNPATEPVSAGELYEYLAGEPFVNKGTGAFANYDYHTQYSELFGGEGNYICQKAEIMKEIKDFVDKELRGNRG